MADVDGAVGLMKRMRAGVGARTVLSCKIRLLHSVAATAQFLRGLEAVGVDAISVHLRQTHDSSDGVAARWGAEDYNVLTSCVRIPGELGRGGASVCHR